MPNPASVGLHAAVGLGYKLAGWHEVEHGGTLPMGEREAGPDAAAELPKEVGTEEWDAALASGL